MYELVITNIAIYSSQISIYTVAYNLLYCKNHNYYYYLVLVSW